MATVVVVVALPTKTEQGASLAPADFASVSLYRDGKKVADGLNPTSASVQISDLNVPSGSYKYTATATVRGAAESNPSPEVAAVVPLGRAAAPVIVSISIQ